MQCIGYFGDLPNIYHFVALWNLNLGVNEEILKCAVSWKWLNVEQNGWKFGTRGSTVYICRVLWIPDYLSLGSFFALCKFAILRFSKCFSFNIFHQISIKLSSTHEVSLSGAKMGYYFSALLDHVSRAHEIEICPSAVGRVAITSEPNARIFFLNFICGFSWTIRRTTFLFIYF